MTAKISRKQLKQDKFAETVFSVLNYAQQNVLKVIVGIIFFVALVGLAFKIGGSVTGGPHIDEDAERALATARTEFGMGRFDAGAGALEDLVARHGGSRAAREATYLLGNAYFESGDFTRARETFRTFLDNPLHKDLLREGAQLAIAACYEETGDHQAAYDAYHLVWEAPGNPASRLDGAFGAARCALALKRQQAAAQLFQAVLDTYPASPQAVEAEYRLQLLNGAQSPS